MTLRWTKLGLVWGPDGLKPWARHSALTPTPMLHSSGCIRVFAGVRDEEGVSRIAAIDVDRQDPRRVLWVSPEPVLDVGRAGAFDDNGVILGDVLAEENRVLLIYIGFQKVARAKFLAFSGWAESHDGGDHFVRLREHPLLDRSEEGIYFRAIHSVLPWDGGYRVYYSAGDRWEWIDDQAFPSYDTYMQDVPNLESLGSSGTLIVKCRPPEYRIGRPRVSRLGDRWMMLYTRGTLHGDYLAGLAWSEDGLSWKRSDQDAGLVPSPSGWDDKMLCYPALITTPEGRTFAFYNGNDMGREGFGVAELVIVS